MGNGRRLQRKQRFGGLALRISFAVFAATLFTSLVISENGALAINLLTALLSSAGGFLLATWRGQRALALSEKAHLHQSRLELESRNEELQRANEVLEQLSITDGLTHLHNHRFFQDQFAREAKRVERSGSPLCLVLIDIDDFKDLNDRLGHAAGDTVLRGAAQAMSGVLRETDTLCRYGGEEFALLSPQTDLRGAISLAEKVRSAVAEGDYGVLGPGGPARITVSIGVAEFAGSTGDTFDSADRALYEAKEAGKDCVTAAAPGG
jgi:diguanylate cyclase (GGDEF)-like protein